MRRQQSPPIGIDIHIIEPGRDTGDDDRLPRREGRRITAAGGAQESRGGSDGYHSDAIDMFHEKILTRQFKTHLFFLLRTRSRCFCDIAGFKSLDVITSCETAAEAGPAAAPPAGAWLGVMAPFGEQPKIVRLAAIDKAGHRRAKAALNALIIGLFLRGARIGLIKKVLQHRRVSCRRASLEEGAME
jgi:hypothetical protein